MIFDPVYWLVIGAGMILSLWAQFKVKGTFHKFSQRATRSRMTGAEVAKRILAENRIHDVTVEPIAGGLTDHYDPRTKVLRRQRHGRQALTWEYLALRSPAAAACNSALATGSLPQR